MLPAEMTDPQAVIALTQPIPILLCFDVEPDETEVAREPRPWLGFERLVVQIGHLRDQLAAATGRPVLFNWFVRMDPQIADSHGDAAWVVNQYGDRLSALRAAGDVIGLHPHAWRWSTGRQRWIADHGDASWVDGCIRTSFETFRRALGEPCRSLRFGDRFLTPPGIRAAVELGALYDMTVEPGARDVRGRLHGAPATGHIPSMIAAPRMPYRASVMNPLQVASPGVIGDDAGLWMIPLTSANPDRLLPPLRRLGRRLRYPGRPLHRPAYLFARGWPPQEFWRTIEAEVDRSPSPHLAFAVRSDIAIRRDLAGPVTDKMNALLSSQLVRRLLFTTPDVVVGGRGAD